MGFSSFLNIFPLTDCFAPPHFSKGNTSITCSLHICYCRLYPLILISTTKDMPKPTFSLLVMAIQRGIQTSLCLLAATREAEVPIEPHLLISCVRLSSGLWTGVASAAPQKTTMRSLSRLSRTGPASSISSPSKARVRISPEKC
jgi:hypothetical protein